MKNPLRLFFERCISEVVKCSFLPNIFKIKKCQKKFYLSDSFPQKLRIEFIICHGGNIKSGFSQMLFSAP
jgi:hypothetical protein